MHRYLIRLRKEVFDLLKVEAKARGISINDFITYCIEVALAEYMNESAEAFKDSVKDKVIQRKGNDYKVSKSHGKMYYDLLNDNLSKSTIVLFTLLLSNSNQKGDAFSISSNALADRKNANCEKAGVKQIRPHDFRHSCASLLINKGANIQVVAKYLGHTKIEETLKTYSHLFISTLDEIINVIDTLEDDKTED